MGTDDDGAMLLAEFARWLDRERGLPPASVRCYSKQAKYFLAAVGGPGVVSALNAGAVTGFMVDRSRGCNEWSVKVKVTAAGVPAGRTVPSCWPGWFPAVASWRLSSYPPREDG